MKNVSLKKMLLMIAFILMTVFSMNLVTAFAEVDVNGIIDEADWRYWLKDDSEPPIVDVYWCTDPDHLYIGLMTDDANENSDVLEFAFRASEKDYWIQVKPGISTKYRPSGGDHEGWWKGVHDGLPTGVDVVSGKTGGNRSYEISIELSVLGKEEGDLPESFVFWYMVLDGASNGPDNYYPDSRAGWWFEFSEEEEEEIPLEFSIPELPLGTMMALMSMLLAIAIYVKKPSIIRLPR